MATYVTIARWRYGVDPDSVSRNWQGTVDYFNTWESPMTCLGIYGAVDLSRTIAVWETDDPALLTTLTAQYLGWADIEVIPVLTPEHIIPAMAAGDLITQ